MEVIIRPEERNDYILVERLVREAFWNLYRPGCDEHYLIHIMRDHPDYVSKLSYVAEIENEIIGSIVYTKSKITDEDNNQLDTITFGPICVHPKYQRKGIGSKLISKTQRLVSEMNYPLIIIQGDPHNYCKYGFKNAKDFNICDNDGKNPLGLLVLELKREVLDRKKMWRFYESSVYDLDQEKVEEYDKTLEYKEKKWEYSQEIFSILSRSVIE